VRAAQTRGRSSQITTLDTAATHLGPALAKGFVTATRSLLPRMAHGARVLRTAGWRDGTTAGKPPRTLRYRRPCGVTLSVLLTNQRPRRTIGRQAFSIVTDPKWEHGLAH
jgi:hypothetical protein